jgi:hypothetical protein
VTRAAKTAGAILWHQRAARALVSTFLPFCLPWDMEIEYHFKVAVPSVTVTSICDRFSRDRHVPPVTVTSLP